MSSHPSNEPLDSPSETQAAFHPFNPNGPLSIYFRTLPHWRQPGATYFVTFRQDDSVPSKVLAEWLDIRERFYRAHGLDSNLKTSDPDQFVNGYRRIPVGVRRAFEREQARMLHEDLDRCHGSCILRQADPRQIVVDSLAHFHGQRLWLGDWVVMPNHVHALIMPIGGEELEDLLGSIKKWTSRRIADWYEQHPELKPIGRDHQKTHVWQPESYDRIVRDAEELTAFRRYIAKNPGAAKALPGTFAYGAAEWLDRFAEHPPVA